MSKRNEAVTRLYANDLRCVAFTKNGVYESTLFGIKPLMVKLREDRSFFKDAVVADRVIGKAAAMLSLQSVEPSAWSFSLSALCPNVPNFWNIRWE